MDIRKHHLQQAVEQQIISEQQSDALWQLWQSQQSTVPQFSLNHVLYYLGGLLAIGAMTLFMTLGWETFGGSAIVALCLLYGVPGVVLTEYFHKRGLAIPAGICAVFVVVLVPLAPSSVLVALIGAACTACGFAGVLVLEISRGLTDRVAAVLAERKGASAVSP